MRKRFAYPYEVTLVSPFGMDEMSITPDQVSDLRIQRYNSTVHQLTKLHSDLMVLRVKPDHPLRPHKPGQYTLLGLGNWEPRLPGTQDETLQEADEVKLARRSYSISSSVLNNQGLVGEPQHKDWLEFYIVLVRETNSGKAPSLTPRLFMLREGDRLFMGDKITGAYNLDKVSTDDTVIFLSTGTGEAPHNYMLQQLLHQGHKGQILAACCVRNKKDLGFLDLHQSLAQKLPNYHYFPLTTRDLDASGRKRYIQDLIKDGDLDKANGSPLDPAKTHVFLCGNPAMIGVPEKNRETGEYSYPKTEGVIEILEKRGFKADKGHHDSGNIHFEEYWS